MERMIIISVSDFSATVCADKDVPVSEIESFVSMELNDDFHRVDSHPCEHHPQTRKHYLLNC